jgi:hypothetical protein
MPTFQRLGPQVVKWHFSKPSEAWAMSGGGRAHIVPAKEVAAGPMCSR